jgi:integrase
MLRHTVATRLTLDGVDIVTVKELLGPANINCTMCCATSNDDAKRRSVRRLRTNDKVVAIVAYSHRRMSLKTRS